MQGYQESEFEDLDSLRVLKLLAVKYYTTRKIFLCGLMALNANGDKPDFPRWNTAVDEIKSLTTATGGTDDRLRSILNEVESKILPILPLVILLMAIRFSCATNSKITPEPQ